jgi:hypothetical protein
MPRRKSAATEVLQQPVLASLPHLIKPTAVYTVEQARTALHLKSSTIRREVREKRLRVSKRAGRYHILGEWLLEWIREGEVQRRTPDRNGHSAN